MNRFFGMASTADVSERFAAARGWIIDTARQASRPLVRSDALFVDSMDDGRTVLGRAESGGTSLVYLGMVHHPAPEFGEGTPLDDPNRTAAYLLARFRKLGVGFLDGLCGHFVVAVVEPDHGRLTIARDPGGSRRLFVHRDRETLRFSTKLSDFRGLLGDSLRVDRGLENFLLGYEFLPDGRTVYAGVEVLGPGTAMVWSKGEVRTHQIPKPDPWKDAVAEIDLTSASEDEVIDALEDAFTRALREQLPSAERVGLLLGGFDSALIAVFLKKLGKTVETFSFHYEDESFNQPYTEELARLLGIDHNWVPITAEVMREGLTDYAQRFNQLAGQSHYLIASAHAVKTAADKGIRHMFSGDGCDGLFLGYPTVHLRAKVIMGLSKVAPALKGPLGAATRSGWLERKLGHPYRVARNVSTILQRGMPARAHVASCILDGFALEQLRGPAPPQERDVEDILADLARGKEHVSPVRLAYQGKSLVGLNKTKLEGAGDLSGIVLLSPFLHPGMAGFARALPEELSRPEEKTKSEVTGKYALMQMAERKGHLPSEIIYQPKRSPVTAPVDRWYLGPLRELMLEQLEGLPFDVDPDYAQSLVSPKYAEDLFRRYVGLGRFATHAINVLVTHAAFTRLARAGSED